MDRKNDFLRILKKNSELMSILDEVSVLNLPNYYLAAGSVFQTVWNYSDGDNLMTGIHDIDIVYFDKEISADSSAKNDKKLEQVLSEKFSYQFDIHNEAYMHLWHNGNKVPYKNTENAIERWIATVHAVGITGNSRNIDIFAPYGLEDIFTKTIRPIYHVDNNRILYENKVARWQERFSNLKIIEWSDEIKSL